jgi:hypothetical protein
VTRVARDVKVDRRRLYEWCDKYRAGGAEALRGQGRPRKATASVAVRRDSGEDELTAARRRIAELERKIGQQQVDLDFFRRALRLVQERRQASAAPGSAASTKSSRR